MEAKDLMIDDWVQYGDIHPVRTRVLAINSVDKGKHWYIQAEPENTNSMRIVAMHAVEPIPLTAEILKMNFSSTPDWYWYFIGTNKYHFRIYKYRDKWKLCFSRDGKGTRLYLIISYVHELQHILKLVGIKKEIKL